MTKRAIAVEHNIAAAADGECFQFRRRCATRCNSSNAEIIAGGFQQNHARARRRALQQ